MTDCGQGEFYSSAFGGCAKCGEFCNDRTEYPDLCKIQCPDYRPNATSTVQMTTTSDNVTTNILSNRYSSNIIIIIIVSTVLIISILILLYKKRIGELRDKIQRYFDYRKLSRPIQVVDDGLETAEKSMHHNDHSAVDMTSALVKDEGSVALLPLIESGIAVANSNICGERTRCNFRSDTNTGTNNIDQSQISGVVDCRRCIGRCTEGNIEKNSSTEENCTKIIKKKRKTDSTIGRARTENIVEQHDIVNKSQQIKKVSEIGHYQYSFATANPKHDSGHQIFPDNINVTCINAHWMESTTEKGPGTFYDKQLMPQPIELRGMYPTQWT